MILFNIIQYFITHTEEFMVRKKAIRNEPKLNDLYGRPNIV